MQDERSPRGPREVRTGDVPIGAVSDGFEGARVRVLPYFERLQSGRELGHVELANFVTTDSGVEARLPATMRPHHARELSRLLGEAAEQAEEHSQSH